MSGLLSTSNSRDAVTTELKCRIFALPLALLAARAAMATGLRLVASMLAMVLHENGHAITSWLTGRWAVPLLWVTMHGEDREWWIVLAISAVIISSGFLAWRVERWGWVCAAGAALALQLIMLRAPAGASIVFGGDGGAMVLATALMAMFYAPRDSSICRRWGLRWGLLAIGALSFMHVFRTYSGSIDEIPFGEIEGVNLSDPSLLTELYGWSVKQLVDRYLQLATLCFVVLFGLYVWGWVSAYLELQPSLEKQRRSTVQALRG